MANPPISIPPFSNVPAPGAPVASSWAQQITQYAVDRKFHIAGTVGGTVVASGSVIVMSLTTPVLPTGRALQVTYCLAFKQPSSGAFDIVFAGPGYTITHQQGTGSNATGEIVSYTRVIATTGVAVGPLTVTVNAWGGKAVDILNASSIQALLI